jgi:hypothetical protein
LEEVRSIIPGRIKPGNKSYPNHLRLQYETPTGLKCLAFCGTAIQEVFVVTSNLEQLKEKLKQFSYVD